MSQTTQTRFHILAISIGLTTINPDPSKEHEELKTLFDKADILESDDFIATLRNCVDVVRPILNHKAAQNEDTQIIARSYLLAELTEEYVSLRKIDKSAADSCKEQVLEAIESKDLNKICDALVKLEDIFIAMAMVKS